jgi:hypothetical protein
MDASKTVKLAIEGLLEKVTKKPFVSLDSFSTTETIPELRLDNKVFSKLLKDMDIIEIRNLQKLMTRKQGLVDDEVYKRTQ